MRIAEAISQLKVKLSFFAEGLSKPQRQVLQSFVFALLVTRFQGAVSSLSRHPFVSASQHQLNDFLSRGAVNKASIEGIIERMIEGISLSVRRRSAFLIIDDTLAKKCGEKIEGVGWHYDHTTKTHVWGHKISIGLLVVAGMRLPIKAWLQLKEKDTTTVLFKRIFGSVSEFWSGKLTVLADAYYASYELFSLIEAKERRYIIQIRSNFVFNIDGRNCKVCDYVRGKRPRVKVTIRKKTYLVGDALVFRNGHPYRLVYSFNNHGNWRFFLTNDGRCDVARVIQDYSVRWEIETFIKEVKGTMGFAKCHLRKAESISRYWLMIFLAYIALIWIKLTLRLKFAFARSHEFLANSILVFMLTNHNLKLPMFIKPASENAIFYGI